MTTRRDALRGFAAITASLALAPDAVWAKAATSKRAADPLLVRLCDLVIPATDTPGAVKAGVPAFVTTALQHGLRNGSPTRSESRAIRTQLGTLLRPRRVYRVPD